jgi:hypothetical protein
MWAWHPNTLPICLAAKSSFERADGGGGQALKAENGYETEYDFQFEITT